MKNKYDEFSKLFFSQAENKPVIYYAKVLKVSKRTIYNYARKLSQENYSIRCEIFDGVVINNTRAFIKTKNSDDLNTISRRKEIRNSLLFDDANV